MTKEEHIARAAIAAVNKDAIIFHPIYLSALEAIAKLTCDEKVVFPDDLWLTINPIARRTMILASLKFEMELCEEGINKSAAKQANVSEN